MKQRSIETEKQKKRYETKVDRDQEKGLGVPAYPLARFAAFPPACLPVCMQRERELHVRFLLF